MIDVTVVPLGEERARLFRELFSRCDYTEATVRSLTGLLVPPPPDRRPESLTHLDTGDERLTALIRLFYLGSPVPIAAVAATLPREFIDAAVQSGLLATDSGMLRPQALLIPTCDQWLASDLTLTEWLDQPHYVASLCDAALHLRHVAIERRISAALDLCGGFGLHAIVASRFSDRVIASDFNPRAAMFAAFNADLNGCDNITTVTGDLFETTAGETFDLILCNPPFILTPDDTTTYRSSPDHLDGFVLRVLEQAPSHLNQGGFLQMVCEWAELEGQTWQDRLKEHLDGNRCDVWILPANRQLPSTYAANALQQSIRDPDELARQIQRWQDAFANAGVEAIHGGFIFMRRRGEESPQENWFDITQLTQPIEQPIGEAIRRGFAARDLVLGSGDETVLLQSRPRIDEGLRRVATSTRRLGGWENESITLQPSGGLHLTIGIDAHVATLLDRFDGSQTVDEVLDAFASDSGLPSASARKQGLAIAKAMIRTGILVVGDPV